MAHLKKRRGWEISERYVTPEHACCNRRQFIQALGLTGLTLAGLTGFMPAKTPEPKSPQSTPPVPTRATPVPLNPEFAASTLGHEITPEDTATTFNNFYEFSLTKDRVWRLVDRFETHPWEVEVSGLVRKAKIFDIDDLIRIMPLEERVYRLRCVETWAMIVPWTGFPLKALIDLVEPEPAAKYVRMVTFFRPEQAKGQEDSSWPWPYVEGLTMEEATNELTLLATGMYGKELPKQNGAPIRLVVPWKYGYKSIKSIVSIEFTATQPATFWNTVAPNEYPFESNVDPDVPHPRWSQAKEFLIGSEEERYDTLKYNGYGEYVAHMYE